jgi:hypothetical protein
MKKMQVDLFEIHSFNCYFNFSGEGGFGQLSLGIHDAPDGGVNITGSRECMSKETLRAGCHALIDAIIDALPADKEFGDDHFDVTVPPTPEVIAARERWRKIERGE